MYITEAVTISNIVESAKYPKVRILQFKDRLYKVVIASSTQYAIGETVVYLPSGTCLPKWLLQDLNLWDNELNCGMLGGKNKQYIRASRYALDKDLLSTGIVLKLVDGKLKTNNGLQSIDNINFEKELGLSYHQKNTSPIFRGDIFLHDIVVNKNDTFDLGYSHPQYIDKYVSYQEYVRGRKFYVTAHRRNPHHSAIGDKHNIFICDSIWGKYRFLSNTKNNLNGSIFVRTALHAKLPTILNLLLSTHKEWEQITAHVILRTTAYSNYVDRDKYKTNYVISDFYVGKPPFGFYINTATFSDIANKYNIPTPRRLFEDYYSVDLVNELASEQKYGVVVRDEGNENISVKYNDDYLYTYLRARR